MLILILFSQLRVGLYYDGRKEIVGLRRKMHGINTGRPISNEPSGSGTRSQVRPNTPRWLTRKQQRAVTLDIQISELYVLANRITNIRSDSEHLAKESESEKENRSTLS
jgi:hypothetical protein